LESYQPLFLKKINGTNDSSLKYTVISIWAMQDKFWKLPLNLQNFHFKLPSF
jgi:hypothetical protein